MISALRIFGYCMKKISFSLGYFHRYLCVLFAVLLSACNSTPQKSTCEGYTEQNTQPDWVTSANNTVDSDYRGVGSASPQASFHQQKSLALLRAKSALTSTIATQIKTELRNQQKTTSTHDDYQSLVAYSSHSVSEELLENAVIEDQWLDNAQCRLWIRVRLSKAQWQTTRLRQQIEHGLQQSAQDALSLGQREHFLNMTEDALHSATILEPIVHHKLTRQLKANRTHWQNDHRYYQAQQQAIHAENAQYPLPQRIESAHDGLKKVLKIQPTSRHPNLSVLHNRLNQLVNDLSTRLSDNHVVWNILSTNTHQWINTELRQGLSTRGVIILPHNNTLEESLNQARFRGSVRLITLSATYDDSQGSLGGVIHGITLKINTYRVSDGQNINTRTLKQRHIAFNHPEKAQQHVIQKLLDQSELKDF
jgi:hypothetical protein